ncbi:GntR family transcriptional regulator [Streptomyces sp. TRM66268-LWL]|uniref:GntR family transcriptional regulator n=1 Tax=Streptomyces polyasparticus TaxID=2767826 RepID=A0ABR7SX10_9ACTN|nr:GntR family transcriptional regulator [Streptomyces polyasparticus]MBC9718858.1 GntR family transcriptional regulator [Streptomyces polyasparticus]
MNHPHRATAPHALTPQRPVRESGGLLAASRLQAASGEDPPRYQLIAEDLLAHLTAPLPARAVPAVSEIARRYRIPYATAQFVRRAVLTRLRPAADCATSGTAAASRHAWQRVADDLSHRIRTGQLTGTLPTRPELAAQYQVSVDTVSKAAHALTDAGLLAPASARGTRVLPQPVHTAQRKDTPR